MKQTILVIDDERTIRLLLENFLSYDYSVVCKCDGAEALLWLENSLPDLIICDIQMPNMDGYEFIEKVRHSDHIMKIPVIMLSGSETTAERVKYLNLGAKEFLVKPFNPAELEKLIKKHLSTGSE